MIENLPPHISKYLNSQGRLRMWPLIKEDRIPLLKLLVSHFEVGIDYNEKEVNKILDNLHTFHDRAVLRRELIEIGYLKRERGGIRYWRPDLSDSESLLDEKYLTEENIY